MDLAIVVTDAAESQLIDLMNECIARYPILKLFSLPTLKPVGRRIELGIKGDATLAVEALEFIKHGVSALGFEWEERG